LPLYAYRCTQCGHRFEKIQSFSAEQETVCPKCGGVLERPLTAPRLQFKGAGWYVNDYAAKSSEPAGDAPAAEAKPVESKPAGGSGEGAGSAPAAAPVASSGASAPSTGSSGTTSSS